MASRLYRRAVFCVVALVLVVLLPNSARASDNADDLKVKALTEFKNANYPAAIAYLHEARELAPDDAEVYYYLGYFTQGFLVNGVNPFVFVVWIGFITIGRNNYQETSLYIFLIAILVGIFATDILKSFLADKIKPYLKEKTLLIAYKIIGFILIGFSIRIILLALEY